MISIALILILLIILIPLGFIGMFVLILWQTSKAGFQIPAFNFKTGEFKLMKGNLKKDESGVFHITIFKGATANKKYDIVLPPVGEDEIILQGRVSNSKNDYVAIVTYDGINWTYLKKKDLENKIYYRCEKCLSVYESEVDSCSYVDPKQKDKGVCDGVIKELQVKVPVVQAIPQNYKLWGSLDAQRRNAKFAPKRNWDRLMGFAIIFLAILAFIITVALNYVAQQDFAKGIGQFQAVTCNIDTSSLIENITAPLAGFLFLSKRGLRKKLLEVKVK